VDRTPSGPVALVVRSPKRFLTEARRHGDG
jgi:hypothetical protein